MPEGLRCPTFWPVAEARRAPVLRALCSGAAWLRLLGQLLLFILPGSGSERCKWRRFQALWGSEQEFVVQSGWLPSLLA